MKLNKILASMGAGCFFLILIKLGNYGYLDKYFNFMHSLSRSGNTTSISEYRPTYNKNEPIITDIKPVETSNTKNSIEQNLEQYVEINQKKLPMKNEDNTTIFDIYYKDLDIYMLIITPLERRNFDSEYKKLIAKDVCNDPDHTKFLDNDVSFTYKFFDLNFNMMFEYKINLDLCKEVNFSLKDGYL